MARWFVGHRRGLVAAGALGAVALAGATYLVAAGNRPPPPAPSNTQRANAPSALPGGQHETEEMARRREEASRIRAEQALRQDASLTAPMAGQQPFEVGRMRRAPPTVADEAPRRREPQPEKRGPADEALAKAMAAQLKGLAEGWDGGRTEFQVVLARDAMAPKPAQGRDRADREGKDAARPRKRVLLPGNTGVFAVVKVGANSDVQGAPIVVEIRGGPLDGTRARCAYAQQNATNRNGGPVSGGMVKCTSLTLADGRNTRIDAVLVGPDDMNTVVASRIDDHFAERVLYPAAAGFARGLGQALLLSRSAVGYGIGGGFQSFGEIGLERAAGVGVGAAGAAVGRILEQQAPRGPTFYLDGTGEIGVWFLEPVEVEE